MSCIESLCRYVLGVAFDGKRGTGISVVWNCNSTSLRANRSRKSGAWLYLQESGDVNICYWLALKSPQATYLPRKCFFLSYLLCYFILPTLFLFSESLKYLANVNHGSFECCFDSWKKFCNFFPESSMNPSVERPHIWWPRRRHAWIFSRRRKCV